MAKTRSRQVFTLLLLGLICAAFFLPANLTGINIFDEGFILSGAMVVSHGGLPYRDFMSFYGPGQYYITSAVYALLGEHLVHAHSLHVVTLCALGLTIYLIVKQVGTGEFWPQLVLIGYVDIVLYVKPTVGYPAITATLFLMISALPLAKWAHEFQPKQIILTSCLIGAAGLFRWDFGIFGLIALITALTTFFVGRRSDDCSSTPSHYAYFCAVVPAVLIMATVYIPMLTLLSSPRQWLEDIPLYIVDKFAKWRGLDYIRPQVWAFLKERSVPAFAVLCINLAYVLAPIALVVGAIGIVGRNLFRRKLNVVSSDLLLIAYIGCLCLLLLNQMRVRPGLAQGFAAVIASLPLVALLFNSKSGAAMTAKPFQLVPKFIGLIAVVTLPWLGYKDLKNYGDKSMIVFDTPRSQGIRVNSNMSSYIGLIQYIIASSSPGEVIFSGVQDHSRLFINDALLYFLTSRLPADRFLELEPGISNTREGQEGIVRSLLNKNVKMVVLMDYLSSEPNNTSKSNGIIILDEYIRSNYYLDKTFGRYQVFLRNEKV